MFETKTHDHISFLFGCDETIRGVCSDVMCTASSTVEIQKKMTGSMTGWTTNRGACMRKSTLSLDKDFL